MGFKWLRLFQLASPVVQTTRYAYYYNVNEPYVTRRITKHIGVYINGKSGLSILTLL